MKDEGRRQKAEGRRMKDEGRRTKGAAPVFHPSSFFLHHSAFFCLAGLLAVWGCRPSGPPLSAPELRRRVAEGAAERERLKSFTAGYDLTVSGRGPDGKSGRLRCSGVMVAEGGRVRLRGEKALGLAKIFDLLLAGDELRVHSIHGGKFYRGSLSRALAERGVVGVLDDRGRLDLAALVLPAPALEGPGGPELVFGPSEVQALWPSSGGRPARRVRLAADTAEVLATEFLDPSGRVLATIKYDPPAGSASLHPVRGFHLRGDGPARVRLDLSFHDLEVNGPVKPAAFVLEPPEGVEVIELDRRPQPPGGGGMMNDK
jgi:hypothetical protein